MNSTIVGLRNKRPNSTIVGLVAAVAVLSGGLGLSLTDVFEVSQTSGASGSTGILMGHLEVTANNSDGDIIAYRQTDTEVVDGGEHCILKLLFSTTGGPEGATQGRGEYTSLPLVTDRTGLGSGCRGSLTSAWDVIAIGTGVPGDANAAAKDLRSGLEKECSARLHDTCPASAGLSRAQATGKAWFNGTGDSPKTYIELTKTFSSTVTANITESGLFNSTTVNNGGMLAHQTFTSVDLVNGDSITIKWTFIVDN